jgi:hypothetical protein
MEAARGCLGLPWGRFRVWRTARQVRGRVAAAPKDHSSRFPLKSRAGTAGEQPATSGRWGTGNPNPAPPSVARRQWSRPVSSYRPPAPSCWVKTPGAWMRRNAARDGVSSCGAAASERGPSIDLLPGRLRARLRGGDVVEVQPQDAEPCWHCNGDGDCACIICQTDRIEGRAKCVACSGTGLHIRYEAVSASGVYVTRHSPRQIMSITEAYQLELEETPLPAHLSLEQICHVCSKKDWCRGGVCRDCKDLVETDRNEVWQISKPENRWPYVRIVRPVHISKMSQQEKGVA